MNQAQEIQNVSHCGQDELSRTIPKATCALYSALNDAFAADDFCSISPIFGLIILPPPPLIYSIHRVLLFHRKGQ